MVRQFSSSKFCSISLFSRSISIVTGYCSGDRRSTSSGDIIFFPPFYQCVQTGSWAHSARFAPGCKQRVWIWPFISIYCHCQECILSLPHACSWDGFYLSTPSSLHPNFGTLFRLFKWAYSRLKNMIFSRKLNQQSQAIVIFLQWAKYILYHMRNKQKVYSSMMISRANALYLTYFGRLRRLRLLNQKVLFAKRKKKLMEQ